MTSVRDGVTWSGTGAEFCLFVVEVRGRPVSVSFRGSPIAPTSVTRFPLQGGRDLLGSRAVVEIDAEFGLVPEPLEPFLLAALTEAVAGGAEVAWFGYEGSFHFDHLLTPDVADQVYGVAATDLAPVVATRAVELMSNAWAERIATVRARLVAAG